MTEPTQTAAPDSRGFVFDDDGNCEGRVSHSNRATPEQVVEWCAREIEWMKRGHVAHDMIPLQRAADRLRAEAATIIQRAEGKKL